MEVWANGNVQALCSCGWAARCASHTHGQQAHDRHVFDVAQQAHHGDELARIIASMVRAIAKMQGPSTAERVLGRLAACDPVLHDRVVIHCANTHAAGQLQ